MSRNSGQLQDKYFHSYIHLKFNVKYWCWWTLNASSIYPALSIAASMGSGWEISHSSLMKWRSDCTGVSVIVCFRGSCWKSCVPRTMNLHQVLTGAVNPGDNCFSVGSVSNRPFTVKTDHLCMWERVCVLMWHHDIMFHVTGVRLRLWHRHSGQRLWKDPDHPGSQTWEHPGGLCGLLAPGRTGETPKSHLQGHVFDSQGMHELMKNRVAWIQCKY